MIENVIDEHVSVAITDKNGKIEYANEKFCSVSKYSTEELLMQDHRIINSGYHSKEFMCTLWHTLTKGEIWKGEFKNVTKYNTFYWVDTTIVPFLANMLQYGMMKRDISS